MKKDKCLDSDNPNSMGQQALALFSDMGQAGFNSQKLGNGCPKDKVLMVPLALADRIANFLERYGKSAPSSRRHRRGRGRGRVRRR